MYLYVHGYRTDPLRPQACIQRDPAISGGILTIPCVFLFFSSSFFLVRWFVLKVFLQGSSTDFLTRPQVRLDRLAVCTRKRTVACHTGLNGRRTAGCGPIQAHLCGDSRRVCNSAPSHLALGEIVKRESTRLDNS